MSMDHDRSDKPITEEEGVMFAANPIWERNRKRKGFGGRKAAAPAPAATVMPEPRTFAAERDYEEPMALDRPVTPPEPAYAAYPAMGATTPEPEADSGLVAPIGRAEPSRSATRSHRSSAAPAAIAAGVVALGALGAVGWYATRDNDGIPELAPGQPATSEVATAPLPPVDLPPNPPAMASATPPAAAPAPEPARASTPARAERRMASSARTRPAAAAPSAGDSGLNASTTTTLPGGPQPYSTLNPGATPPPAVTPSAPVTQAAPAPTTESPAAVPATPPTLPVEPPTTQAPTPETPVTPPTS